MTTPIMGQTPEGPQPAAISARMAQWLRLPTELRERPQWALAGADKAPLVLSNGRPVNVSVHEVSSLMAFEQATTAATARNLDIGFVITADDPFTCIDLDVKTPATHPDKPELWTTPEQAALHQSVIEQADSYAERSRSGLGWHIWVRADIGSGKRSRDGVEIYSRERFIICTGDVVRDLPVAERQFFAANMASQMNREDAADHELRPDQPDDDLGVCIAAIAIEDDGELGLLMRGDWAGRQYPSQSEADFALMMMLAQMTDSNGACREAFRLSALSKRTDKPKKYTDKHLNRTLRNARAKLAMEAHHAEVGERIANALMGAGPPDAERHFRLLQDDGLDRLPALRWLVKHIIPDAGVGAIYGDSGTFKSFLTLDLLAAISNGQEWFGQRVRPAPAVYVPFEGQGGVPNRVKAWRLAQAAAKYPQVLFSVIPPDDVRSNVAVIIDPLNLREKADRDKLVATLKEKGWAGGVLCIDTLAHASNGIEENSSAMGEMISIFQDLQNRLGGVILLIHHTGKDHAKGMRGWSGLHAAMDFVIECQHDKDAGHHAARFALTKVKDGPTGRKFNFTMHVIQLGVDEDGDPVTSLAVYPTPSQPEATEQQPRSKTSKSIRDIDAETSAADDIFIWNWIAQEVSAGNYPSKNSLKGQLPDMKQTGYAITQDRVLAAIERLLAEKRLTVEPKSPNGNVWIRPMEATPPSA